jgi:CHAT domain-containing protein/tetratricopeptide (TPR) repeat protein
MAKWYRLLGELIAQSVLVNLMCGAIAECVASQCAYIASSRTDGSGGADDALEEAQALFANAKAAGDVKDFEAARTRVVSAINRLLAEEEAKDSEARIAALLEFGEFAYQVGELPAAHRANTRCVSAMELRVGDDDPSLQAARDSLAVTNLVLGNLQVARDLFEHVLENRIKTLPSNDPQLLNTRQNLAVTMSYSGDYRGARAHFEEILAIRIKTLPEDHPEVQDARICVANTLRFLGEFRAARELEEQVLAVRARTLPEDHPDLQMIRHNLATTMVELGELQAARSLDEVALENWSKSLPEDHPNLLSVHATLAQTMLLLGDLRGARSNFERLVQAYSSTLPHDHPNLQGAQEGLAITLRKLGDLVGARVLHEHVLGIRVKTLPLEHRDVQLARINLANTMSLLGDLPKARALGEQALEVLAKTLADGDPMLQLARVNLADTLRKLGELRGAQVLAEQAITALTETLPEDHHDLLAARGILAVIAFFEGDWKRARALTEQNLAVKAKVLPADHPSLQADRELLALTLIEAGDRLSAKALQEEVLASRKRTLPDDHPDLQVARSVLAGTTAHIAIEKSVLEGDADAARNDDAARRRCAELILEMCAAQDRVALSCAVGAGDREAGERCAMLQNSVDEALSFARGFGVFSRSLELEAPAFLLSEKSRSGGLVAASVARRAGESPRSRELRETLEAARSELAELAQSGATKGEFDAALAARDTAERELVKEARLAARGSIGVLEFDVVPLAERLGAGCVAVAFRRFMDWRIESTKRGDSVVSREIGTPRLAAFVVRGRSATNREATPCLSLVDLGPMEPIDRAARTWPNVGSIGRQRGRPVATDASEVVHTSGDELRALVVDPLLPLLADAQRVIFVLDDILHVVPFDALPLADGTGVVGDRLRIETRATLTELLDAPLAPSTSTLVALGGAAFNSEPLGASVEEVAASAERPTEIASILRGGALDGGFDPLPHTEDEVRGLGALFAEVFGDERPGIVLQGAKASSASLIEHAPQARFLHVATHGWYAPDSIRSWSDPEPIDDRLGLRVRLTAEESIRGMSPMLLCGLALAGANLPENVVGRSPGLFSAEEIAALDLSQCELAVLSACDTNVGVRRAGQGVASLQRALQMAGARSVITSLWKVRDEATKDLMLDFYRRLWVEKKPKWQALSEAKQRLREARDQDGRPLYSVRDWAAWVLTGDPD